MTAEIFTFEKENGQDSVDVHVWESPEGMLELCFGRLDPTDRIVGMNGMGEEYDMTREEFLTKIQEMGYWGFCNQKDQIHIWFSDRASLTDLAGLIAHERGHMMRPYHRTHVREEKKAYEYECVTKFAVDVTLVLTAKAMEKARC